LKILIVDDNASVRRLIATILGPLASEIRECEDGAGAVAAYRAQRADVVLMDIRMPAVDGIAATKEIRITDPMARIVIVTDYDDSHLREAAAAAGGLPLRTERQSPGSAPLAGARMGFRWRIAAVPGPCADPGPGLHGHGQQHYSELLCQRHHLL
jgi:CheY-like chemotaxis protein